MNSNDAINQDFIPYPYTFPAIKFVVEQTYEESLIKQWTSDYLSAIGKGNAPDYGTPIAVIADVTNYGTAIVIEFPDGKKLSPFFNQNDSEGDCYGDNGGKCGAPDDCEFGWCGSDRFNATEDADAWLEGMVGATNWDEWEWLDA